MLRALMMQLHICAQNLSHVSVGTFSHQLRQMQSPPPASPRAESTSSKYDQALEQALARD